MMRKHPLGDRKYGMPLYCKYVILNPNPLPLTCKCGNLVSNLLAKLFSSSYSRNHILKPKN